MRCSLGSVVLLLVAALAYADDAKTVGVTPKEAKDGFVSLFDGKTLDGWQGDVKHYAVEDGAMVCHGAQLFTKKQYANFILRFEFKVPPAGNNGVGIRAPSTVRDGKVALEGNPSYTGMEIQILDDDHPKYKGLLQPYQAHGSVYGVVPAKRGFLKPAGEWNQEEIVADGSRIKVTLNGTVIVDADLSKIKQTIDHQEHPGLHRAKGHIVWLGHGNDPVAFRNVRIKELP
jgi:hypothetical protein